MHAPESVFSDGEVIAIVSSGASADAIKTAVRELDVGLVPITELDAVEHLPALRPSVVIADLSAPHAPAALERLKSMEPQPLVVALTETPEGLHHLIGLSPVIPVSHKDDLAELIGEIYG